ncbi:cytochrome bc complex cytochrome b subunit [Promicromonospora thailandica]|uniref:Cytochrome bc1 complex cytochrome b subunit n=1 Tax=Promicromonospora thailandica TaxID=765201 RepID=A0A9X2G2K8_9MICO|nr:cytochrome bc complex cytochrome b subunit [Promicromonospora thailandica]MCP2265915.1 ubiquinol-cytochrome c reductase cytochrome b subunit [Promicromonospora thailandica]BFF21514.1 cytochrome bc complex cytochrome b subunit [Promicromonospora thailandica]
MAQQQRPTTRVGKAADYLDQRTSIGALVNQLARKVFPDHWSFMLGEIALFSFVVLIASGFFLTMFFEPSMALVRFEGEHPAAMQGQLMSAAFRSTVEMSFEVRGGLLMRQIHHWAALIFVGSIVLHMFRIFFTGAFRKPREVNWLVGALMLVLALAAGFSGYSLPDDVLSGNGLRIIDGVVKSIPLIGSYLSFLVFGGEFPGEHIIPRLFTLHIFVIPGLLIALIALHLFLMVLQKHTQYPGGGRTDRNVVGYPALPVYVAKMTGNFFIIAGVLTLMGATMAINNVWNYGPYDPSPVSAGTQPDWYILFVDGALRLMPGPGWEWVIGGYTLSMNLLIPAVVVPGILFTLLFAWPFVEARVTGDRGEHHVLDRPRNRPVRTAMGVALFVAFMVCALAATNDLIATHFSLSIFAITWVLRVLLIVGPVLAFWVTKRVCLGLQRKDRELVLHGHESGRIVRFANGEYVEVHTPLDEQERWLRVSYESPAPLEIAPLTDSRGVRRAGYRSERRWQRLSRFFYEDRVEPVTPAELEAAHAAHAHGRHAQVERPAAAVGAGTERPPQERA